MATPIVHVVLTDKIFDKFFKDKNKKKFFIGTCLPDIRYIRVIDRNKTHFKDVDFYDLGEESSFFSGLKFHSILDKVRENYVVKNNTYDMCPNSKFSPLALKILEERVLYNRVNDWKEYIGYLDEVLLEEKSLGLNDSDVKKWHRLLQENFSQQPTEKSTYDFSSELFFTDQDIREINRIAKKLKSNKKILKIIKNLYDSFESLIERHKTK
jgi:hypothetical protein